MRVRFWTLGFVLALCLIPASVTRAESPAKTLSAHASALVLTPPVLLSKTPTKRSERLRLSWSCSRAQRRASTGAQMEPCFGLTLQPRWSLRATAEHGEPRTAAPTTQRSVSALPKRNAFGVGKRIALKSGRELSLQLTPTPTRCAPLLQLTY
jgi:hypothetical protein